MADFFNEYTKVFDAAIEAHRAEEDDEAKELFLKAQDMLVQIRMQTKDLGLKKSCTDLLAEIKELLEEIDKESEC